MPARLHVHFEPQKGWINDPNGLIYYKGQYHAFYQHNPYAPHWDTMHWGHAVSDDLLHWKELPIALRPDQEYENGGGCFSGSAVEKDGKLYLIYTSVSKEGGQTQSVAVSEDGIHFQKYWKNPVIRHFPPEGSEDFRDPKVTKIGRTYYMVCASGKDGVGKILLYCSKDLMEWKYEGVLHEGAAYGGVLECPDFFPFGDKYLLMFSQMGRDMESTMFIYGDFDGKRFEPISWHMPQTGPHYYAPQTFEDDKGRRIIIGWLNNKDERLNCGADYAGAFTIPCTLEMRDGTLCMYPVQEAQAMLAQEDPLVIRRENGILLKTRNLRFPLEYHGKVKELAILRDTKTIEVFVNGGQKAFTYWYAGPEEGSVKPE